MHRLSLRLVLAVWVIPAQAKNSEGKASDIQQSETSSASPPCYSYEPKAYGTWTQLPCQEVGAAKPPPQRRSAARSLSENARSRHAVR